MREGLDSVGTTVRDECPSGAVLVDKYQGFTELSWDTVKEKREEAEPTTG